MITLFEAGGSARPRTAPGSPVGSRSYVGEHLQAGRFVRVTGPEGEGVLLAQSGQPLWSVCWSEAGFSAWELAWAIIFDATADDRLADDWGPVFGAEVVARLPAEGFVLDASDVLAWLDWPAAALPSPRSYS